MATEEDFEAGLTEFYGVGLSGPPLQGVAADEPPPVVPMGPSAVVAVTILALGVGTLVRRARPRRTA